MLSMAVGASHRNAGCAVQDERYQRILILIANVSVVQPVLKKKSITGGSLFLWKVTRA